MDEGRIQEGVDVRKNRGGIRRSAKPDASVYHIRPQLVHCCHIRCLHDGVLQSHEGVHDCLGHLSFMSILHVQSISKLNASQPDKPSASLTGFLDQPLGYSFVVLVHAAFSQSTIYPVSLTCTYLSPSLDPRP